MSTTIAALIATLITTGMTSAISHPLTLLGGAGVSLAFGACGALSRDARLYPVHFFGALALCTLALLSSEATTASFTSTTHVLASYAALAALAVSSSDLSAFCRQVIMGNNLLLTFWILHQARQMDTMEAWQISNPSGAGNLMAAQINMTLPMVMTLIQDSKGLTRVGWLGLLCMNCTAVFLVMSRNGIGAMLAIIAIYFLFNYKRLAISAIVLSSTVLMSLDNILSLPFVHNLLVKLRLVGYVPTAPRSVIWRISWDGITQNPIWGVGPGEPRKILAVLDINHAHNNFVQVAFETGLPSAAIFLVMMGLLLWLPCSTVMRSRRHFVHTLPIAAYMIFSWTGGPLTFPGATLLLAVCVNEARVAIVREQDRALGRGSSGDRYMIAPRQRAA